MITDARGIRIKEVQMTGGMQKVDVSKLAKGVYIIKVMNGDVPVTAKFVKQ
jgi:hypothetical protein